MRIDVWSDFGCPFCVIGKTKLEHALEKFVNRDQIEVVYRSFQLDPHAENRTLSLQQLALEKSMTVEQLKAKQAQVAEMIKNETGLSANYDPIVISNTFDAHRLVHFAAKSDKGTELTERIFHAYLSQSLNIADHNVLVSLGKEAGLNEQEVADMLSSDAYKDAVRADIAAARELTISSLPAFVFNNEYLILGAQSEEVFSNILNTILEKESNPLTSEVENQSEGDHSCTDGSCNL
ncbi:DsbA family oxidoreductase [Paenibacillus medicaginis]|uniref:DsbA family protein n=1 Tax=Paenibacillus medicaginis TaxID=1470560 RepID=A0ABV5C7Z9_9BACL